MGCLSNERPELDLDSGKGRNMNFSVFLETGYIKIPSHLSLLLKPLCTFSKGQ